MFCTPLAPLGDARARVMVEASPEDTSLGGVGAELSDAASEPPSTQLPGEVELAGRKPEWAYAPSAAGADVTAPGAIAQPRNGQADDLKKIKGVGPKLEALLHALGVFHYDQITAWGPDDIVWMDENLNGFKGRVSRDDWVAQAKALTS